MSTRLTIDEALTRFLDDQRERLAPRTFRNYEDVVELLRHCMDGYGPNLLSGTDYDQWKQAFDNDEEDAFCTHFGAEYIVDMIGEFLGYFMVRKVMAGQELLRASGTVTKKLVRWLENQDLITSAAADVTAERSAEAARDLPAAERLATALYELSLGTPIRDRASAQRWVEESLPLTISNVAPGELWFSGNAGQDIGPVSVPSEISQLAQPGWAVTAVLAHARKRWWFVEVANVYS